MAEASRTGGMVSREAVLERIAARAAPIPRLVPHASPPTIPAATAPAAGASLPGLVMEEVDFAAVDRVGRAAGVPVVAFVARAAVDAVRAFPALASVIGDERLADLRLRAMAERVATGEVLLAAATSAAVPDLAPGQLAALGVGDVRMRAVAVTTPDNGWGLGVHPVGNLSLAYDRRAVRDTEASGFLARVRQVLEQRDWDGEL